MTQPEANERTAKEPSNCKRNIKGSAAAALAVAAEKDISIIM